MDRPHSSKGELSRCFVSFLLPLIFFQIPAEFMKGEVVVTGPAYAELGGDLPVRADEMSVEMEESAGQRSRSASEENDIVEDDGDNVVEINLK